MLLSSNQIKNTKEIVESLKRNTSLNKVDVRNNILLPGEEKELMKALKMNKYNTH